MNDLLLRDVLAYYTFDECDNSDQKVRLYFCSDNNNIWFDFFIKSAGLANVFLPIILTEDLLNRPVSKYYSKGSIFYIFLADQDDELNTGSHDETLNNSSMLN